MFNRRTLIAAVAAAAVLFGAPVSAQDKSIVVSSTTSTQDSACLGTFFRCSSRKPESK